MKYYFAKWRRMIVSTILMGCFFSAIPQPVYAAQKLYDQVETHTVTKGVTYEKKHRLTDEGWLDLNVLKVDLKESNIRIAPVGSKKEYGLKDTVFNLLSDSNAAAGVNASYFGMKGKYSSSFGVIVDGGNIESMGTDINNQGKNEYATFFLDKEGNPFIDFFRVNVDFLVNGVKQIELAGVNKVTDLAYPICFNKFAAPSTKDLDARFSDLTKIVVENGVITKISAKGETVNTPENGYVIIVSGTAYDEMLRTFAIGAPAQLSIMPSLDLDKIQVAVSGGGKIIENGVVPADTGVVFKTRQPRTAIGITGDKSTLYIITVDGRGDSIGATQEEMAALLREYGVTDAMNMDGGGSTTMAVKTAEEDTLSIKNQVSDGAQRKVINALGIFNDGPVGEIRELVVKPSSERAFAGSAVTLSVYGYDEYYHKIPVPLDAVAFNSTDELGSFNGSQFLPGGQGKFTITATYNGFNSICEVESMTLAALEPSIEEIHTELGQNVNLTFRGISQDGFSAFINGTVQVSSDLGSYANGVFTPTMEGSGYITAVYQNAVSYIPITVGGETKLISSFEGVSPMNFTTQPSGMPGEGLKSTTVVFDQKEAVGLKFQFSQADTTQAAYLHFLTPIAIPGKPSALGLAIYGNNSGAWVRGKLKDANGKEILVDFTKNLNWEGWQEVSGSIPAEVTYPLTLETLYVAELTNNNTEDQIVYFDKLTGRFPYEIAVEIPQSSKATDVKNIAVGEKAEGSYFINIAGNVTSAADSLFQSDLYTTERNAVHTALQQNADLMVYAGASDVQAPTAIDQIRWENGYKLYEKNGISFICLTATNGSMRTTNTWQWMAFKADALNSPNKNIAFLLDRMPSAFRDPLEAKLFQDVLSEIREAGKNVYVVSASGTGAWNSISEGIRYINLPNLWLADGSLNPNFKILKLKVIGDDLIYEISGH